MGMKIKPEGGQNLTTPSVIPRNALELLQDRKPPGTFRFNGAEYKMRENGQFSGGAEVFPVATEDPYAVDSPPAMQPGQQQQRQRVAFLLFSERTT